MMSNWDEWCYFIDRWPRKRENNAATRRAMRREVRLKMKLEKRGERKMMKKRESVSERLWPLAVKVRGGCHSSAPLGASSPPLLIGRWLRQSPAQTTAKCLQVCSHRICAGYVLVWSFWKRLLLEKHNLPPVSHRNMSARRGAFIQEETLDYIGHVPGLQRTAGQNLPKSVFGSKWRSLVTQCNPFDKNNLKSDLKSWMDATDTHDI